MNKQLLIELLHEITGHENIKLDEPMRNHTSFKVGGPADILITPENAEQLGRILHLCTQQNIPLFVMGNGTNLIVRDKGIRGIVIKIFDKLNRYSVEDDTIIAEGGILLSKVSIVALQNGLQGLEFASGIPGTLGGAVTMNAGAYGGEMKDVVVKTEFIDAKGDIQIAVNEQHQFGYRTSFIQQQGGIVVRSEMKLKKGDKTAIKELMDDLNKRRKDKQPLEMPSAGSVFKRPEGHFAGKLIEDCGLRGYRIGGAEVSYKHCGFIVNADNASCSDILQLIQHIQGTVKSKFGVELHTEVKVVGEE